MGFPRLAAFTMALLAMGAGASGAAPDEARAAIAQRLSQVIPDVPASRYPLGAAAFDEALRDRLEGASSEAAPVIEAGRALWQRRFKDARSLASCFPNGGRRVAAAYPLWEARLKRVVTLEMAINQCLKSHGEPLLELADPKEMGAITAYLRSLSNGQKLAVRVPPAAEKAFEQGRRLWSTRMGQRNFACASCHLVGAGRYYGETPLSPVIGQATHWPVIRGAEAITLQARIRECLELMGAAPFPAGSEELNHVEYFLAVVSNGLPLRANVARPAK
jgi:sulfur-oxidizing protein SoxA